MLDRIIDNMTEEKNVYTDVSGDCTCPKTSLGFVMIISHDCPIHGHNVARGSLIIGESAPVWSKFDND